MDKYTAEATAQTIARIRFYTVLLAAEIARLLKLKPTGEFTPVFMYALGCQIRDLAKIHKFIGEMK
jgi:hypothetical protein